MVRTDAREQKLEAFFPYRLSSTIGNSRSSSQTLEETERKIHAEEDTATLLQIDETAVVVAENIGKAT